MTTSSDKELIKELLKDKDITKELHWVQEELAELIVAISHHIRGRDRDDNLADEIGDVRLCLKFLEVIFEDKEEDINKHYLSKIERIKNKQLHNENKKET